MFKSFLVVFLFVLSIFLTFSFVSFQYSNQVDRLLYERTHVAKATFEVTNWYKDFYCQHQQWPDTEDLNSVPFDDSTALYRHTTNQSNARSDYYEISDETMTSILYFEIVLFENGHCMAEFRSHIPQPSQQQN